MLAEKSIWGIRRDATTCGHCPRIGIKKAKMLLLMSRLPPSMLFMRSMQELLLNIWQQSKRQILLISHDIEEALFLATDLVVMVRENSTITSRLLANALRTKHARHKIRP